MAIHEGRFQPALLVDGGANAVLVLYQPLGSLPPEPDNCELSGRGIDLRSVVVVLLPSARALGGN